jgi:hypothetical protein
MSQEIKLSEDSDDNGEWPNTASVPSLPLSRKRPREKEELSNHFYPCNESGPGGKTVTGSGEFVADLELADEVDNKQRRGVVKIEPSGRNDAAGECVQNLKGDYATEKDDGSEDGEIAEHPESHEGIAVAVSHPMSLDSEQTRGYDGSATKHSQRLPTFKPPSNASGRQWRLSAWEDLLSELANYRKIHGHCNVPQNDSENTKLANWVATQRNQYSLHLEGKASNMTISCFQELESLGFEWDSRDATWKYRLSELADYRKIHGNCNVPHNYSENSILANWVGNQRGIYKLHLEGKTSPMTNFRILELEFLGFEWDSRDATWQDRLSELAEYRKINGHCNVPENDSNHTKLANWVVTQRKKYSLHLEGKKTPMTPFRIQELESLGFIWDSRYATWKYRLSELTNYRTIHGHCNIPQNYSENTKLANWVATQRNQYRYGEKSNLTLSCIQELESLGFEWGVSITNWGSRLSELADYCKIHGHCNVPQNCNENAKLANWVGKQKKQYRKLLSGKKSSMTNFRIKELESLVGFEWESHGATTTWEDYFSELADYRKIQGHCNVPHEKHSDDSKLAHWVGTQRRQYKLRSEGKASPMTLTRIQALESLGFEWRKKGNRKKPGLDDHATRVHDRTGEAPEHVQTTAQTQEDSSGSEICSNQDDITFEPEDFDWNGEVHLAYIPGRTEEI